VCALASADGSVHRPSWPPNAPQVRVKAAAVPADIAFSFAYTDPKQDFDVSYHMDNAGMVEAGITAVSGIAVVPIRMRAKGGERASLSPNPGGRLLSTG
jgi:hypothetical protein